MSYEKMVVFQNPRTGETKSVGVGWSWILFLFSTSFGIPLFSRRLYHWGYIVLLLIICYMVSALTVDVRMLPEVLFEREITKGVISILGLISFIQLVPFIGLSFYLGFKGNEITARNYLENGWVLYSPDKSATQSALRIWGLSGILNWSSQSDNAYQGKGNDQAPENGRQKKEYIPCPFCAEEILPAAKICKHCKSDISQVGKTASATTSRPPEIKQPAASNPVNTPEISPVASESDTPLQTFRVILAGVNPDVSAADARLKLATLFKATPEQIDRVLANTNYIVKKELAQDEAARYKSSIEAAGGLSRIEMEASAAMPPPLPPQAR